ncbi:MAG: hypothetical protein WC346_02100 [Methanogenium sp.]
MIRPTLRTVNLKSHLRRVLAMGDGAQLEPSDPFIYNGRSYYLATKQIAVVRAESSAAAKKYLATIFRDYGLTPETTRQFGDFNVDRAKTFSAFAKTGSFEGQSAIRAGNKQRLSY